MAIQAAFMVPHPPLIVPEIGRGGEEQIRETTAAYEEAAKEIAALKPETLIITSPHSLMYADYFHISPGDGAKGSFRQFRAGQVRFSETYDTELRDVICRLAEAEDFPAGTLGERDPELDHGTMVPLRFIRKHYAGGKILRIGLSGLPLSEHYRLGQLIARAVEETGRNAIFVASGDLSHKLQPDGPYGFAPEGPEYDGRLLDACGRAAFGELLDFDETFCEKAAECGHRSFVIMAGALDGLPPRRWFATVTGRGRPFQPARDPLATLLRHAASRILVRKYRRVGKLAAGVLTLNPDDLELVRGWSPELREKAALLPLGEGADVERFRVDAALRAEWRHKAGYGENDVVCAFVGRFLREKGVETLLDLAEADRDADRKWLLVGRSDLGGDGNIDLRIGELRNAGKLRVLPWQNDLRPLYNGIDFLIHPSIGEGMPVAPIEAMGCGASVLLLDAPGSRELPKAGEGCRALATTKPGAWLSALDTWSATDRAERGTAARATAEKFDSRIAAAEIARILDGEAE